MNSLDPEWSDFRKHLEQGARAMDAALDGAQMDQFVAHAKELLKWNRFANLTSITGALEMAEKHYLDTLPLLAVIPARSRVLDIGSGGGFPGIPLKVLRADLDVMLIEASRKKTNFLKQVIRTLGLKNAEARHVRAEDFAREVHDRARPYDVVVSKAVWKLDKLLDQALPLVARPGRVVAMKGKSIEEELRSIEGRVRSEGLTLETERYRLPGLGIERALVVLAG
jgi:16S rRNA (guanine527-N7)-methyltransferase